MSVVSTSCDEVLMLFLVLFPKCLHLSELVVGHRFVPFEIFPCTCSYLPFQENQAAIVVEEIKFKGIVILTINLSHVSVIGISDKLTMVQIIVLCVISLIAFHAQLINSHLIAGKSANGLVT